MGNSQDFRFLTFNGYVSQNSRTATLVNMYAKCQEGKVRKNEERRAEEIHRVKMKRLSLGFDDDFDKN